MFDYRYHALSLAAVLFALALGVLIGVAIGDTNLVSSAKSGIVHNLNAEVGEARSQADTLQDQLSAEEAFSHGLYPLAVHELLNGRSIGLVFLGDASNEINSLVKTAVTQGDGTLATVVAVRKPLNLTGIAREAAGTHYAALSESPALLESFGELIGRQLVSGGQRVDQELLSRVRGGLLSAFDGQLTHLEGVIVARSPEPEGISAEEAEADSRFEDGLVAGISAAGVRAVGVEMTSSTPSQIPWFKGRKLSSVDNLDEQAGQAALLYALAGYSGSFGTKATADSLLPTVNSSSQSSTP
jgi:Copper transport outer membrane protein, MctB